MVARRGRALDYLRASQSTPEVINSYFDALEQLINTNKYLPQSIWNFDETYIPFEPDHQRIYAKRGSKSGIRGGQRSNNHVSLAVVGNAEGEILPPLFIFSGERISGSLSGPVGSLFTATSNGFMEEDIFNSWFEWWVARIPQLRPVLLIMDGHSSHITLKTIESAKTQNIDILLMPAHMSHLLQPLDLAIFSPLKGAYKKAYRDWY